MSQDSTKQLTLFSLVLMIFTSVYGFANMPRAFFLMGYGAIPWYLVGALLFFLPYAFMMAEYGAAYKHEKGGIYSWMASSVGPKYAFIGTFMWYASYLVWQVNVSTTIWVPLSNAIFGRDLTQTMTYFGMSPTKWLGILAALWVLLVTFVSTKGLDKIKQITSVGGLAIMLLNVVLLVGGLIVLALHGGQFAQPINDGLRTFAVSPNPAYQSPLSIISFLTYAIFAYGGIEAVGGLVDQTKNAEKTFPVGVTISAIVISVGYSLGIFLMGIFINWEAILSLPAVNTANVTYIVMQNLGYTLAIGFGLAEATSLAIGMWVARLVGLSMFLALTGAFFTLIYSPLKQLIEGTPAGIWPKRFTETKNNMPAYAMRFQATLVIILILVVSFGGDNASALFNKLVTMTNVAMTIPYMFLAIAFPFFKKKEHIVKPFAIYKSYGVSLVASIIVTITIGFANIFSIIEPGLAKGYWIDTLFAGGGPVIFAIVALLLYHNYESKQNS
ncbi:MAG: glutamate/gamma-aminobutyrate family transporter YjeM [Niameybacter sp.]|uniref:glutamate/gamma-aminobutyrate family transporter YjeM n=1 Tax=Niameybacter sp. TaxID=2033640 RepID=UPI002FCA6666